MEHRPGGAHRDWPEWARTDRVWADGGWTDGLGAAYDWPRPGWPHTRGSWTGPGERRAAAFADGRRLREAAERRRAHRQRQYARHPHPGPTLLLKLIALLLAMSLVGAMGFVVVSIMAFALTIAAGTAAFVVGHRVARTMRGGAAGAAPLPARPAAPQRPDLTWSQARSRFERLRAEYAAYECDPMEVLRLPALADVTVASTGRFVEAFAEAQARETDVFPGPGEHATGFAAAVDRAERAWRAARDAAERIRLSNLSPAERGTVERVIKLLTTARDSDSDAERLAAYSRARSELARLDRAGAVHVPRPAQAALDASARGALPA